MFTYANELKLRHFFCHLKIEVLYVYCRQIRIFVNQLQGSHRDERLELSRDLQAIRMAAVNPILDPWVYILLRKTVVLKLMQKIKCLFCKMGGRQRGEGSHFQCADGGLSSSFISRDSPSLMSHELRDLVHTSQTLLFLTEGHQKRQTQVEPAQDEVPQSGFSQRALDSGAPDRPVKDSSIHASFTEQITNTQEKSI